MSCDCCSDLEPLPVALVDSILEWLSKNGTNRMESPLGLVPGGRENPAANYRADDLQTGPGSPKCGELWWLLRGVPRLWLLDAGLALLSRAGVRGLFRHANTADRIYSFPDHSGAVAVLQSSSSGGCMTRQVTDSPVLLLAADPDRLWVEIINQGTNDFWLGFDASVVPGDSEDSHGGRLMKKGGGGVWSSDQTVGYTGDIYGVCQTGKSTLAAISKGP